MHQRLHLGVAWNLAWPVPSRRDKSRLGWPGQGSEHGCRSVWHGVPGRIEARNTAGHGTPGLVPAAARLDAVWRGKSRNMPMFVLSSPVEAARAVARRGKSWNRSRSVRAGRGRTGKGSEHRLSRPALAMPVDASHGGTRPGTSIRVKSCHCLELVSAWNGQACHRTAGLVKSSQVKVLPCTQGASQSECINTNSHQHK